MCSIFLPKLICRSRLSYSGFEATVLRAIYGHCNNNCKPQRGSIKNSFSHANSFRAVGYNGSLKCVVIIRIACNTVAKLGSNTNKHSMKFKFRGCLLFSSLP